MKRFHVFFTLVALAGSAGFAQTALVDSLQAAKTPVAKDTAAKAVSWGHLKIATAPDSSDVLIDSVSVGISPYSTDSLQPGIHSVVVKRKGFFGKKITVDVAPDSTVVMNVSLVKPATLIVKSDPIGAKVLVDGKDVGASPFESSKIKPGEHLVRIEMAGFPSEEKSVNSREGMSDTLQFKLQAPVAVASAPPVQKKLKPDSIILISIAALFCVFGIVIFGIESTSN
jgi:hypothetical protein